MSIEKIVAKKELKERMVRESLIQLGWTPPKRTTSPGEAGMVTDFLIKEALQQRRWYLEATECLTKLEVEESLEGFEQKLVEGVNEILTETKD